MTITIISRDTEVKPGQFVCGGTSISNGTCTGPREVVSASPSRVYYNDVERKRTRFMLRENALYLCDTEQEGMTMFNLTYERELARDAAQRAASAKVTADYAPRVRALIADDTTTKAAA